MKLSNIANYSPLEAMLLKGTGKAYFNKSTLTAPAPVSGPQGGSYDGQLSPRLKEYFGGSFGT